MFCMPDVHGEVWSATGPGFSLLFGRKSDSATSLTEKTTEQLMSTETGSTQIYLFFCCLWGKREELRLIAFSPGDLLQHWLK